MDEGVSKLLNLVKQGNLQGLKELVEDVEVKKRKRDCVLNSVNKEGMTALHVAAYCGHPSIIRWLLSSSKGGGRTNGFTNILARTKNGSTAMHLAAGRGHLECCQALVEGCKIENGERAEMLNAVNNQGRTALHFAAQEGHLSVIRWLLSSSEGGGRAAGFTNILAKTINGETVMHLAAFKGHLECCQALVEGCKIEEGELLNAVNRRGMTALHIAVYCGHSSIIRWLLCSSEGGGRGAGFTNILAKTSKGATAMHYAAERGHLECCQALVEGSKIENGERAALLNAVAEEEWTVLHVAAYCGHSSIIGWVLSSSEGGGRAAGFTMVLAKTSKGSTAMHLAAGRGHLECFQALLEGSKIENGERAALLNAVDNQGWTSLHCAARSGHSSIIRWLLSSSEGGGRAAGFTSSSITMKATNSITALLTVIRNGSVEALNALLSGCTAGERLTLFLSVDEHGWTPLHSAARFRQPDIIRELLLHHPETQTIVDARDHRGMTALHRAVIGGIDEESKKEWVLRGTANVGQEAVISALLTALSKSENVGEKQQQADVANQNEDNKQQQQRQEEQSPAAMVNLGIKIE